MTKRNFSTKSDIMKGQGKRRSLRIMLKKEQRADVGQSVTNAKRLQAINSQSAAGKTRRGDIQAHIDTFMQVAKPRCQANIQKERARRRLRAPVTSTTNRRVPHRQTSIPKAITAKSLPVPSRNLTSNAVRKQSRESSDEKERRGSPIAQEKYPEDDVAKQTTLRHDPTSALATAVSAVIELDSNKGNEDVPKIDVSNISLKIRRSEEEDEVPDSLQVDTQGTRQSSGTELQTETVTAESIHNDTINVALSSNDYPEIDTRETAEALVGRIDDAKEKKLESTISLGCSQGNVSMTRGQHFESERENINAVVPEEGTDGVTFSRHGTDEVLQQSMYVGAEGKGNESLRESGSTPNTLPFSSRRPDLKIKTADCIPIVLDDSVRDANDDLVMDTRHMPIGGCADEKDEIDAAAKQVGNTESRVCPEDDDIISTRPGLGSIREKTDTIVSDRGVDGEKYKSREVSESPLTKKQVLEMKGNDESVMPTSETQSVTRAEIRTKMSTLDRPFLFAESDARVSHKSLVMDLCEDTVGVCADKTADDGTIPTQIKNSTYEGSLEDDDTKEERLQLGSTKECSDVMVPDSAEIGGKSRGYCVNELLVKKGPVGANGADAGSREEMAEASLITVTEVKTKTAVRELEHDEADDGAGVIDEEQTLNTFGDVVEVSAVEAGVLGMTQDQMEDTLRLFDYNTRYGPFIGIDRYVRWERAKRFGMNPPPLARLITNSGEAEDQRHRSYLF